MNNKSDESSNKDEQTDDDLETEPKLTPEQQRIKRVIDGESQVSPNSPAKVDPYIEAYPKPELGKKAKE